MCPFLLINLAYQFPVNPSSYPFLSSAMRFCMFLLDLDSTLLDTYGHQEGEGFNFRYQSHGYHPLKRELLPLKAGIQYI